MKLNHYLYSSLLTTILLTGSCKHESETGISDILENTLPAVVTVKLSETSKGKTAFGFADNALSQTNAADVAYAEILKLDEADGAGSGFIIEEEGKKYIVTNAHVIDKAESLNNSITVYTYDRKEHQVKLEIGRAHV
jgi:S1-C subfamily serine protease